MRQALFAAVVASALFAASSASAGNLDFVFDGIGSYLGVKISWRQDSSPTPISVNPGYYTDIAVTNYQASSGAAFTDIFFWTSAQSGGFSTPGPVNGPWTWNFLGAEVYAGTLDHPVFTTGTYSLTDGSFAPGGTLTISDAPAPVPGAGLLSLAFFALVGLGAKARPFLKAAFNLG